MTDAESLQPLSQEAPFDLPVSMKTWVESQLAGFLLALVAMGVAYEATTSTLIGPVSVAEATGFTFYLVWGVGILGPYSPFAMRGETNV